MTRAEGDALEKLRILAVTNLWPTNGDVGDVAQVLDGVQPSAVVGFPLPWGGAAARTALVRQLADRTAEVLRTGARSTGRRRTAWLDSPRIAERVVGVLREAIGR